MNDRDQRRYNRLTSVQTFGEENAADFAAGSKSKTHFAKLDALIVKLDDAKAGQSPNRVSKSTLLDAVLIDLKNIARTSRSIELTEHGFPRPIAFPTIQAKRPSPLTPTPYSRAWV